jgi:hypothetical protein
VGELIGGGHLVVLVDGNEGATIDGERAKLFLSVLDKIDGHGERSRKAAEAASVAIEGTLGNGRLLEAVDGH